MENVDVHDSCEAFQEKRVKIGYKQMRRNSLSNLLTEISEIRKVIEAEENEKKKCKSCANYKRLYRRFWYRYWADDVYYCTVREEFADAESGCEAWRRRKPECDLSSQRFDEVETDIKTLMAYCEDD